MSSDDLRDYLKIYIQTYTHMHFMSYEYKYNVLLT